MIILETSEARKGTRLPQSVINSSVVITGLETLTGADMVISPLSTPKLPSKLKDTLPHRTMLAKHTRSGLLVQRKHGLDLITSLQDLCAIENRMISWCGRIGPKLLGIGNFADHKGMLMLNGNVITEVPVTYKALQAALDYWQLRGGGITMLCNAKCIPSWLNHWHQSVLHQLDTTPTKRVIQRAPSQRLVAEESWWIKLASISGIGPVRAEAIANWLPDEWQGLAYALCCLSDVENVNISGRPAGVGAKTFTAIRDYLGIEIDERLVLQGKKESQ